MIPLRLMIWQNSHLRLTDALTFIMNLSYLLFYDKRKRALSAHPFFRKVRPVSTCLLSVAAVHERWNSDMNDNNYVTIKQITIAAFRCFVKPRNKIILPQAVPLPPIPR